MPYLLPDFIQVRHCNKTNKDLLIANRFVILFGQLRDLSHLHFNVTGQGL